MQGSSAQYFACVSSACLPADLASPPGEFSARYVPFAPGQNLEEAHSLDEVIYTSKDGGCSCDPDILNGVHAHMHVL